jgi:hypothetical protein
LQAYLADVKKGIVEGGIPAHATSKQLIYKEFPTMIASQIIDTIGSSGSSDFLPVIGERQYFLLLVNSSEFKEGKAVFDRGLTTRDNPYSFLSPEYWRWQEGLLGNCQTRER